MSGAQGKRPQRTNEAVVLQLRRPLPDGVQADISFADAVLARYAAMEEAPVARYAVAALGHFRLAAVAATDTAAADRQTLEFDLAAGAAIWHLAETVAASGRWLAEAYDLRLPQRVRPDPARKELLARLAFADPGLRGELEQQQAWMGEIQDLGRRVGQEPLRLFADPPQELPGPAGSAPAPAALAAHLKQVERLLRLVAAAAEREASSGPRPVREEPDDAWLFD